MSSDSAALFAMHASALLASALTDTQRRAWTKGLRGLRRRRIASLATLIDSMPGLRGEVALTAVDLIARYGRQTAVPLLLPLLHRSGALQGHAARTLSTLGGLQAQRGCIAVLQSEATHGARYAAAYALAWLREGDARTTDALIACLRNGDEAPEIRGMCAENLNGRGPYRRRAATAALAGLSDASPEVRFWCIFALSGMRYRPAIPVLRRLAATDHSMYPGWWRVSSEARDALAHIEGRRTRARRASTRGQPKTPR